jgi:hypothetical protein
MAGMTLARLALFVTVYVALDVSTPRMSGVLTYASDPSIEMRQPDRFRGQTHAAAPVPRAPERVEAADRPRPLRRRLAPETLRLRQAHVARSRLSVPVVPASPSEDH